MKYQLIVPFIIVLVVGCSPKQETTTSNQPSKDSGQHAAVTDMPNPASVAARKERRDWWFKATEKVANTTGDKEARELVTFLQNNSVLVEPYGDQGRTVETSKNSDKWFMFVPLMPGDENAGSSWAMMINSPNVGASFHPGTGVLTVRSEVISDLWAGIALLHEVKHVRDFINEGYNWQDNMTYCRKERDTHEFENRLIAKLGGNAYRNWLAMEVDGMATASREAKLNVGESILLGEKYPKELDEIFGVPRSEFERAFRATHCDIAANFQLIDKYWRGDKEEQKAVILFKLYRKDGILPTPEP